MSKQTFPLVEQSQVQFPLKHAKYPNRLGIVQSIDGNNVELHVLDKSEGEYVTVKASEFTVIAPPDEASTSTRTRRTRTAKKVATRKAGSKRRATKKGGE